MNSEKIITTIGGIIAIVFHLCLTVFFGWLVVWVAHLDTSILNDGQTLAAYALVGLMIGGTADIGETIVKIIYDVYVEWKK